MTMKIKVKCDKFNYGGNVYSRGDIIEVGDVLGMNLVSRNKGLGLNDEAVAEPEKKPEPVKVEPVKEEPKPVEEPKEEEKPKEEGE